MGGGTVPLTVQASFCRDAISIPTALPFIFLMDGRSTKARGGKKGAD